MNKVFDFDKETQKIFNSFLIDVTSTDWKSWLKMSTIEDEVEVNPYLVGKEPLTDSELENYLLLFRQLIEQPHSERFCSYAGELYRSVQSLLLPSLLCQA